MTEVPLSVILLTSQYVFIRRPGFQFTSNMETHSCLHAQGVRVTEVPLSADSLNSGDVFILDLGQKIIVWAGSAASGMEKNKALTYTIALRDDRDHKGTAQVQLTWHSGSR